MHAERNRRGGVPREPGPGLDRTWLARIALAVIVALALTLVARVSMLAFDNGGKRIERFESGAGHARVAPAPRGSAAP